MKMLLPPLPEPPICPIPEDEIDHVNDLYIDMRRRHKKLVKDAMELGDWFSKARKRLGPEWHWYKWLRKYFPKIGLAAIWKFQRLASNREFLTSISTDASTKDCLLSIDACLRLISQKDKMAKPRVRRLVVSSDADPLVLLEAKLKNYVINLWMLRYLQTEIEGMLESMELTPDQVLKVLHYVCKEHHEVEAEVLRTFNPGLKVVSKGA